MKTLTKILLLVLTLALSVTALAACGGDDGEVSYREVSADEWKAAFVFDNATMVSVEKIYSDGKVANQYTSHVYFVDDYAYDAKVEWSLRRIALLDQRKRMGCIHVYGRQQDCKRRLLLAGRHQ